CCLKFSATKRNEATRWLRKSVGVVAAKDLPAEPSEQNFRMGLRSGLILCSALNKIEPGAVPKLVGVPFDSDSVTIPDGSPLSSSPYYENIINFLLAIEERGLPTFEGSDLEQGGRLSRVVNSVLALKAYSEWKRAGGHGTFRYVGNRRPSLKRKQMVCMSLDMNACDNLWKNCEDKPIHERVRDLLLDHKPRDIPIIVEIVLSNLIEDYEQKLAIHKEKIGLKTTPSVNKESGVKNSLPGTKASPRNIFHEMESRPRTLFLKEVNTSTKGKEERKSFSKIMNEMRKKASTDIDKPSTDINSKTKKNVATTAAMNSVSDEADDDVDVDNLDDEMEEDITLDSISVDEEEEDDEATAGEEKVSGDVYGELEKKKRIERRIEVKNKEIEKIKEMQKKKEMERESEMEKKREIRKNIEIERKIRMEKKAVEDANQEKQYSWVNGECERLKRRVAKQQSIVEHQNKAIQVCPPPYKIR
ncbi:hypothetical protein M8C21_031371, partial [Ambrosia artemisiifolia]